MTSKKKEKPHEVKLSKEAFFSAILEYIEDRNNKNLKALSKKTGLSLEALKEIVSVPEKVTEAVEDRKRILLLDFWANVPNILLEKIKDKETPAAALATLTNTYAKLLNVYNYALQKRAPKFDSNSTTKPTEPELTPAKTYEQAVEAGALPFSK